jgi:uncharacterized protein
LKGLSLLLLPERFAACRLEPGDAIPMPSGQASFFSVTRTPEELSIVCREADVPPGARLQTGFRAFRVEGPLDFGLVGVLESLLSPLAAAEIPVFAVSTYDTDYVLVREGDLKKARLALAGAGHDVYPL